MPAINPRILIIGGGFAGLAAARAFRGQRVTVTLVDRRNHHLFQPLLYQVATAGLSAADIAAPIRQLLRRQKNVRVLLAEVAAIEAEHRRVRFSDGQTHSYDALIVAAGMTHSYFGNDAWAAHAPGLKTLGDALEIRRRVLLAFEAAEREPDEAKRRALLTFVVVGAGPTGVELAGALAEIARHTLCKDYKNFEPESAQVLLVEGGPRVLGGFDEGLSDRAYDQLRRLGVDVRLDTRVTRIDADGVTLGDTHVPARTVLWGAGVKGAPLAKSLGVELDRAGRIPVGADLSVPAFPEIFVTGDLARFEMPDGAVVPGVAPAAIQMGRHAARNILRQTASQPLEPFEYRDKGALATVGRKLAVAHVGGFRLSGTFAWLIWLFVHIMYLVGFRNRVAVLWDWAWAYFTWDRSARVVLERRPGLERSDE